MKINWSKTKGSCGATCHRGAVMTAKILSSFERKPYEFIEENYINRSWEKKKEKTTQTTGTGQ